MIRIQGNVRENTEDIDLLDSAVREAHIKTRQKDRIARATKAGRIFFAASIAIVVSYFVFFAACFKFACNWTFGNSLYFVVVSTTTVGYGDYNFGDKPFEVRLLFYFQSICGFLMVSQIAIESQIAVKRAEVARDGFLVRGEGEENHPDADLGRLKNNLVYLVIKVVGLFVISTGFYAQEEGWTIDEAFYFSWSSLSTIGFGDLYPTKDSTKVFTSFLLLTGCGLFGSLISTFASYHLDHFNIKQMNRLLSRIHTGERMTLFDTFFNGEITGGEFLMGYLVTLGKVRSVTAKEILAKFRDMSLGEPSLNVERFIERKRAILTGLKAGEVAAEDARLDGWPVVVQATRAGKAAAKAAAAVDVVYQPKQVESDEVALLHKMAKVGYDSSKISCLPRVCLLRLSSTQRSFVCCALCLSHACLSNTYLFARTTGRQQCPAPRRYGWYRAVPD
jgi:hypothetical protein